MRQSDRQQWKEIEKQARRPWQPLIAATPAELARQSSKHIIAAWKNNRYVVMEFPQRPTEHGIVRHLIVQRVQADNIHNWNDLQRIKNEVCGPESLAFEVYPPESKLVNDFHVYHLWVLPEGYPIPGIGLMGIDAPCAPAASVIR